MASSECHTSRLQRAMSPREILQEQSPQYHETKPLLYSQPVAYKFQSWKAMVPTGPSPRRRANPRRDLHGVEYYQRVSGISQGIACEDMTRSHFTELTGSSQQRPHRALWLPYTTCSVLSVVLCVGCACSRKRPYGSPLLTLPDAE